MRLLISTKTDTKFLEDYFFFISLDVCRDEWYEGKEEALSFLTSDGTGDRTRECYTRNARIIVFMACRVYFQKEMYLGVQMSEQLQRAVRRLL